MTGSAVRAQGDSSWTFTPGLSLVRLFPGQEITGEAGWYGSPTYRFAANGVEFRVRTTHPSVRPLAFTFGAGASWFYENTEQAVVVPMAATAGVGQTQKHDSFTVFPIALGAEVVFPGAKTDRLMVFAGAEGNLNLISGDVEIGQQAQLGYTVKAGFAVKAFEFGVRYTRFSDLSNLGVVIGLRFASFTLD